MKTALKLFVMSATIFTASAAMAECPTNMPTNELIHCLIQEDHEPDITELMVEAAAKNKVNQASETASVKLVKL